MTLLVFTVWLDDENGWAGKIKRVNNGQTRS